MNAPVGNIRSRTGYFLSRLFWYPLVIRRTDQPQLPIIRAETRKKRAAATWERAFPDRHVLEQQVPFKNENLDRSRGRASPAPVGRLEGPNYRFSSGNGKKILQIRPSLEQHHRRVVICLVSAVILLRVRRNITASYRAFSPLLCQSFQWLRSVCSARFRLFERLSRAPF